MKKCKSSSRWIRILRAFWVNPSRILQILREIRQLYRGYHYNMLGVVGLTVLATLSEVIGLSMFIPLLQVFFQGDLQSGQGVVNRAIYGLFHTLGLPCTFGYLALIIMLLMVLRAVLVLGCSYYQGCFVRGFEKEFRERLFSLIMNTRWDYFVRLQKGLLINMLVEHVNRCTILLYSLVLWIVNCICVLCYLGSVYLLSFPVTVLALVSSLLFFISLLPLLRWRKQVAVKETNTRNQFANLVYQYLNGLKLIKVSGCVPQMQQAIAFQTARIRKYSIWARLLKDGLSVYSNFFGLAIILLLCLLAKLKLTISLPVMGVLLVLYWRTFSKIQSIHQHLQKLLALYPSLEFVQQQVAQLEQHQEQADSAGRAATFEQHITVQDGAFSFDNQQILQDLNFTISRGMFLGIVGPSGAGKSTLIDLLMTLLSPQQGAIKVDGVSLQTIQPACWHRLLGYVPQESFMLNDTILNNIIFFSGCSPAEAMEAARKAHVHDFIMQTPQGYQTLIGDNGIRLSGGQRQRLALARALARNPRILILDEATNALDCITEQKIMTSLRQLRPQITIIAIAHRLATIMEADQILVLEHGRIVAVGSPQQLRQQPGVFQEMYQRQARELKSEQLPASNASS